MIAPTAISGVTLLLIDDSVSEFMMNRSNSIPAQKRLRRAARSPPAMRMESAPAARTLSAITSHQASSPSVSPPV